MCACDVGRREATDDNDAEESRAATCQGSGLVFTVFLADTARPRLLFRSTSALVPWGIK